MMSRRVQPQICYAGPSPRIKAIAMDDQAPDQTPKGNLPEEVAAGRRAAIDQIVQRARAKRLPDGPDAAHSADHLYGEDGLPV